MRSALPKIHKTAAMAATSYVGDSPLFLLDFLLRLLRVAVLLSIWRLLLAGKGTVSGMTLPDVLIYTLIAEVFAEQLMCRTGLVSAFWDGTIAMRFVRPLGVFAQFAAEMCGKWAFGFAFFSLPLLLCAPLFGVNPLPASAQAAALFPLSLALGIAVGLALEYCFAALAVGMEVHPFALDSLRAAIGTVLSGALIPLALLPWNLGTIFGGLPFAATASVPLRIYTGTGSPLPLLVGQAIWIVILWPLAGWLWRKNRERMVSYGG